MLDKAIEAFLTRLNVPVYTQKIPKGVQNTLTARWQCSNASEKHLEAAMLGFADWLNAHTKGVMFQRTQGVNYSCEGVHLCYVVTGNDYFLQMYTKEIQ